ncbi:helix-turn-helix domain-containing protein [Neolewinella aurantiaca]|uniref:Helix-turn-helix domain-containing protein n=1 Tax=Neolewinella aurantiaca TaxID=2602767 RepID=A0A5C7FFX4_9BACT|nr:helix-turn-helix domain-containing protein [Neolewinella aurantiaca]TXF89785.1 helix-turn-helix domain-containing protein [Neolewinella aurantiaca]
MDKDVIIIVSLILIGLAMIVWGILYQARHNKTLRDTQRIITDLELLRLFERQPGGILSAKMVADKTGLTAAEASSRLSGLAHGGLLLVGSNPSGMKQFYELSAPLEERPGIQLSGEPFLTIEDLQEIFIAYDYKVSPHDLMVATGLPWNILAREMKYFRQQGITELIHIPRPGDSFKQYILQEEYHRSGKLDIEGRTRLNEKVKQVLYDERFLV